MISYKVYILLHPSFVRCWWMIWSFVLISIVLQIIGSTVFFCIKYNQKCFHIKPRQTEVVLSWLSPLAVNSHFNFLWIRSLLKMKIKTKMIQNKQPFFRIGKFISKLYMFLQFICPFFYRRHFFRCKYSNCYKNI